MKIAKKFKTWHRNIMAIPEFSMRYEPSKIQYIKKCYSILCNEILNI